MKANTQNLETIIASLGGKGRFQIMVHLLAASTYAILVFNHVIMAFHGTPIAHECMAGVEQGVTAGSNDSHFPHFYNGKYIVNTSHSKCSSTLFFSDGGNETMKCSTGQWKYSPKYDERNIVSQFDLVCDNKHLSSLATTIYFAGVMVGGLVFGDLADRVGRLPIMLFTLYASVVVGVATAFSVSYTMFVALRFLNGILMQGLQTSVYTLIMELFLPKHRPFAGAVTEVVFGMSVMLLAGLAYAIQDWKYLQIAISLPGVFAIFYPWLIPESLRWLIMKGKKQEAEALTHRICKMNKVPFPEESWQKLLMESNTSEASAQKEYNLTDMFRTSHIRKRSLILFYVWLAISTSYYGLTFKMTRFRASRYLVFFIGGAVETLAYALSLPIMRKFGRKKPLLVCFIFAAVMCVSAGLINQFTTDLNDLTIALALAGRCAVACLFAIIFVYTSEIYPTVIRNIGMGACCFWARMGGVLAPQINQWTQTLWGFDAIIIFGALALVAGFLLFPLPETHNKRLPDTLGEAENDDKEDMTSSNGEMMIEGKNTGGNLELVQNGHYGGKEEQTV